MKKTLFILPLVALLASCGVNQQKATRTLEAQGFKDVQIGGYSWFGCGKDDSFASNFTATGADGQKVSGTACSGWIKGITIRFD